MLQHSLAVDDQLRALFGPRMLLAPFCWHEMACRLKLIGKLN